MQPYHHPGIRSWNYYSAAQSPWHVWFEEMGYPQLDIMVYDDGEWEIIEYQNSPLIPSLTRFKTVLAGLRNIEISWSFIKRYVDELNPMSARFWETLERHEKQLDIDYETREAAVEDRASRAAKFIVKNPELMERIARNGFAEMDLRRIRKQIPDYKFRKDDKSNDTAKLS